MPIESAAAAAAPPVAPVAVVVVIVSCPMVGRTDGRTDGWICAKQVMQDSLARATATVTAATGLSN